MPQNDPTNYGLITYMWILILSAWGGTAHNIRKIREGDLKRFSITEWIGDMVVAGFIGVITFYLCEYAHFEPVLTAAVVGITSHQGTRGIILLERAILKRIVKG